MQVIEREKVKAEIRDLKTKYGDDRSALLPILHELQNKYNYLSDVIMQETAHSLEIGRVEVGGVVSC